MGRPSKPLREKLVDQLRSYPNIPVSMILVNHHRREVRNLLTRLERDGVVQVVDRQQGRRMVATYCLTEPPPVECSA